MKYALPAPIEAPWERPACISFIVALHALLVLGALTLTFRSEVAETLASIDLRVIENPGPARKEPERPLPPVPLPQIPSPVMPIELPVLVTLDARRMSSYNRAKRQSTATLRADVSTTGMWPRLGGRKI